MRIKFLGTATSTGIPEIGCTCAVCTSRDSRDKRLRASVMVYTDEGKSILIDCGPDFREQMLKIDFLPIDGVLLTHEHYDHVGGIDDLRPFCKFGDVQLYAENYVADALRNRIPYCFTEHKYPGVPEIVLHDIENKPFGIEGVGVEPVRLMHARLPIFGYRIRNFAYLTDLKTIPEEEYDKLQGLDVLVMNALRIKEHISHQNLEQALEQARRIGAKRTYFTHLSHHMGLHSEVERMLPEGVFLPYDGLEIEL
jgi:Metal-dependent hydrolases of the beta-lactamase superfamily I